MPRISTKRLKELQEWQRRAEQAESKARIVDDLAALLLDMMRTEMEAIAREEAESAVDELQVSR